MDETALKPREEQFCQKYTVCYEGKRAAIAAGYAEKSAAKKACLLLKDPRITARIREIQKELADRMMLTRERMVMELMDVVDICKAAKPVEIWDYIHHEMRQTGEYQIDAKGAVKALELLGKYLGLFDKQDTPTGDTGPVFYTGEEEIKE